MAPTAEAQTSTGIDAISDADVTQRNIPRDGNVFYSLFEPDHPDDTPFLGDRDDLSVGNADDLIALLPVDDPADLFRRSTPTMLHGNKPYNPGVGSQDPSTLNNNGFFALFALIGVGMVLTSIWFFFWAKNGGCVWRKGDWEDYKSTVLRRKGPDGRTMTNATKTTMLGQQSIAGSFDVEKQQGAYHDDLPHRSRRKYGAGKREPSDDDVRAYRQEKAAKVGGLNRQHDGSHWGDSSRDHSDVMTEASDRPLYPPPKAAQAPRKKGFVEKQRERKQERREMREAQRTKDALRNGGGISHGDRSRQQRRQSFSTADDSVLDASERYSNNHTNSQDNYYNAYRSSHPQYSSKPPAPPRHSYPAPPRPTRQSSPPKRAAAPKYPGSFDAYSDAGDSDTGTKVYSHPIAGAGRESGFRRGGGGGRRDSLSDSDGGIGHRRY